MRISANNHRYENRVVLVTGGGAGLGEAICKRLASEGARVAVLDVQLASANRVVAEIRAAGGHAEAFLADVTDFASVTSAVAAVVKAFGGIDVAVNNAGIACPLVPTAEQTLDMWNRVVAVNLTGVFHSMKAELPLMLERGGAIINMASIFGTVGVGDGVSPYVATKHGVVGLTKAAALEYGKQGIRVTAVCPTFVKTPMTLASFNDDARWAALDARHALGRCVSPEDVATMVAFLGSDDAALLTGNVYLVDAGITAGISTS